MALFWHYSIMWVVWRGRKNSPKIARRKKHVFCFVFDLKKKMIKMNMWPAGLAQLVEQLICNQKVGSSSLLSGTTNQIAKKFFRQSCLTFENLFCYNKISYLKQLKLKGSKNSGSLQTKVLIESLILAQNERWWYA